jgi:hypothetical protein
MVKGGYYMKWYKLRIISVSISLVLLVFCLLPLLASAAEGPCRYWGEIFVNSAHPATSKVITAWINGVQYGQATSGSISGQQPWQYLLDVPPDNLTTQPIEGGKTGDTVLFKIEGINATPTATWLMGQYVRVDLNVQMPTRLEGDVNGDGVIDPADALMVGQHIVKIRTLTGDDFLAADVNDDGIVDPADRLYIRQYIVHIRNSFPGGTYIP